MSRKEGGDLSRDPEVIRAMVIVGGIKHEAGLIIKKSKKRTPETGRRLLDLESMLLDGVNERFSRKVLVEGDDRRSDF